MPPHEREAFRRPAVIPGRVRALIPLDAREIDPVVVRERVQTRADWDTAAGCRAVWVAVVLVQGGVVVEVLLHMDDIETARGELGADQGRVVRLVAALVVALEELGQTSNVEGQSTERAAGSSECDSNVRS